MKQKSTTTNTHEYKTPPTTQAQQTFDTNANTAYDMADPTIPYTFGNLRENVSNKLDNPFGFNYSPEVAEAQRYSQNNMIDQAQGQAGREDTFNRRAAKTSALAISAGGHAPQLVQSGGTQVSNPGIGGLLMGGLSAGASLGSAALM